MRGGAEKELEDIIWEWNTGNDDFKRIMVRMGWRINNERKGEERMGRGRKSNKKTLTEYFGEKAKENLGKLIQESDKILNSFECLMNRSNDDSDICKVVIDDNEYYFNDGIKYDPDSSPVAWAYYKIMYRDMIVIENKVDNNYSNRNKCWRIKGTFNYGENTLNHINYEIAKTGKILLAGDTVFNFKKGGETDKAYKFDNFVNKAGNLKTKLELCRKMHHSPYNFSLMSVTGGMNNRKGLSKKDRPDWLLYDLNRIYSKQNDTILKEMKMFMYQTQNIALNFLFSFNSFKEYVKVFYHLNDFGVDKLLVDAMLKFGKIGINSSDDLDHYMDLAIAYWTIQRYKYCEEKNIKDDNKDNKIEEIKSVLNNIIKYVEKKETNTKCQNTKS